MAFSSEFNFEMSEEDDEILAVFLAQSTQQTAEEKQQRESVDFLKVRYHDQHENTFDRDFKHKPEQPDFEVDFKFIHSTPSEISEVIEQSKVEAQGNLPIDFKAVNDFVDFIVCCTVSDR